MTRRPSASRPSHSRAFSRARRFFARIRNSRIYVPRRCASIEAFAALSFAVTARGAASEHRIDDKADEPASPSAPFTNGLTCPFAFVRQAGLIELGRTDPTVRGLRSQAVSAWRRSFRRFVRFVYMAVALSLLPKEVSPWIAEESPCRSKRMFCSPLFFSQYNTPPARENRA